MIALALLAGAPALFTLDDPYEENDTCAEASVLVVPADGVNHSFSFVSSGAASPGGVDEDWFAFDVPAGHGYRVFTHASFPGNPGVDTFLWTGSQCGTLIDFGFVAGPYFEHANTTGANRTYQIQFLPTSPTFVMEGITLGIWIAPLACSGVVRDGFEPNESPATAAAMAPGLYRGLTLNGRTDRDVYRVRVDAGDVLQMGFGTRWSFGSPAVCEVRDLTGSTLLGSVPSGGGVRSFVNTTSANWLLVSVALANQSSVFMPCEEYDLFVSAPVDPCAGVGDDVFEFPGNDVRSAAVTIQRGRFFGLTLTTDDVDWFAVDVPPGFGVRIIVFPRASGAPVRTELYQEGQASVYQRQDPSLEPRRHHYGSPASGPARRVEFKIEGPVSSFGLGCAEYDMAVQFVPEIATQPYCSGSSPGTAAPATVHLFGSTDPSVGLLWFTIAGLTHSSTADVYVYVGMPRQPVPTNPGALCIAQPVVRWADFRTFHTRFDVLLDGALLVPLSGTTLALQTLMSVGGATLASDAVTFIVP